MFHSASVQALFGLAVCVIIFGSLIYFLRLFFRMGKESQGWSLTRGAQSGTLLLDGFIHIERDSVCMGDDCMAPNPAEISYYPDEKLSSFIKDVVNYLPLISAQDKGSIVWSVLCGGRVIAFIIHDERGNNTFEFPRGNIRVVNLAKKGLFCGYFPDSTAELRPYDDEKRYPRCKTLLDKVKAYYDNPSNVRF